ncbi:cytochrome C [uncultured Xanthomonas sp.]|uniref:cytochrome C n=1 Tax=uncultured Xanthomonas sp. TaxID=152831 RepID=UPI0025E5E647|nr:cytochrome C [uncultured Xanthomonas sp.]
MHQAPSSPSTFSRSDRTRGAEQALLWSALGSLLLVLSPRAAAVPAFARQTGSSCADCHIGAYGPALTPYGMRFKLGGYTDSDGNGTKIPVSAQLTATRSVPARGESRTRFSEADLYLAGRITDNVGGYVKVARTNNGKNDYTTRLDNVDLRAVVKSFQLGGKDTLLGVSVNNNPGSQDPIGMLPNASGLGPASAYASSTTLLNQSSLSNRVIGTSVYGLYDRNWYGELGTYTALPLSTQDDLGYAIGGDPGKLSDTGYLRLSYMKDLKRQFFSAGVVALTTRRQLPRSTGPRDDFTDLGYDLNYQFLGTREHILKLGYLNIYERRRYGSALIDPTNPALAGPRRASVRDQSISLNYTYKQSYSLLLAHFINTGSDDPFRYRPYGAPDTTSNLISASWAPFGKDDSYSSISNLRLSATWFRFSKFNGSTDNVFGATPVTRPRDLNQFALSLSLAF